MASTLNPLALACDMKLESHVCPLLVSETAGLTSLVLVPAKLLEICVHEVIAVPTAMFACSARSGSLKPRTYGGFRTFALSIAACVGAFQNIGYCTASNDPMFADPEPQV